MASKRTTRHDSVRHLPEAGARWGGTSYKNAPTKSVSVGGTRFVYRALGIDTGVPVIFLNHLAANLDNWDPRVVDGIAAKHRVITFDNRGVGGSEGTTPDTVEAMAHDAVAFIRALGLEQVDLLGFSLGGMVSQMIAQQEPALVRKVILAGTGPAGGDGIVNVTKLTYLDTFHAYATFKDPKELLFFPRTDHGKLEAKAFIRRLKERTSDRDKAMALGAFRTQLKAIHAWGLEKPADLSTIHQPVLVANGDDDRMVPTRNSYDLAQRLPNATLRIYPDAGHGGIFQAHERFVPEALEFLGATIS
jgi:pimeloyl-ACP methyl ester carboxylesterase